MNHSTESVIHGVVVEEEVRFTLVELSRACRVGVEQLAVLVDEGVLTPSGDASRTWHFEGTALRRARTALRLSRDLQLSAGGTALVLDLLDEIDVLKAQLRRLGGM
jgi:chaperone modulatory protein CbpM